jgi:lysophospholipase L1-like esterase
MKILRNFLLISITLLSCTNNKMQEVQPTIPPPVTDINQGGLAYLALGDSYTIGESVPAAQSFPYQLSAALNKVSLNTGNPTIIARTGWTTDELIAAIKSQALTKQYDIVTLLIGVNNQYRHYNIATYRTEFVQLLNTALAYAKGNPKHVFVLSIPDWGATPYASGQDATQIGAEIDEYNGINQQESVKAGVSYINITPISRQAKTDLSLVANDGLHPSGKMYGQWVQLLADQVTKNLK